MKISLVAFLLVLSVSAQAARNVVFARATDAKPVDVKPSVLVERLRVRHVGGPVLIYGATDDTFRISVDDIDGLQPHESVSVVLTEVDRGNFILETSGPPSESSGAVSVSGVSLGRSVSIGRGVEIGGVVVGPLETPARIRARLMIHLPMRHFMHLSAQTQFGDVILRDLIFTHAPELGRLSPHVLHAQSGDGKVDLNNVLHARLFTSGPSGMSDCRVQLGSGAYDSYFQ